MKFYRDISKSKSYFYYFGWTILAFLGGFFLLFFLIFQAMFYVKRTERIEFFIAAHGLKDDNYFNNFKKLFAKEGLIDVNVYSYLEDDPNIYNYFSANGEQADFIIFSETNVNDLEELIKYNYVDLSTLESDVPSISEYDTFEYENVPYGIKIYDPIDDNYNLNHHFQDLIEFTKVGKDKEAYYLLVDTDSPNFDKEKKHTLGLSVLEYLLSDMLNS